MRKIYNIQLKTHDKARSLAIFTLKAQLGISLNEARDLVNDILRVGQIEATYIGNEWGRDIYEYNFSIIHDYTVDHFEGIMSLVFSYSLDKIDRPSNENMREPCEATKKALAWLETLTEDQKDMVKLISDWEHPYYGVAAIC